MSRFIHKKTGSIPHSAALLCGTILVAGLSIYFSTVRAQVTAPPQVAFTAPADGATVVGQITLTANASDDVAVVGVQFYEGAHLLGDDTKAAYSFAWDTRTGYNGVHTITAVARDGSGNTATDSRTVTVANTGTNLRSEVNITASDAVASEAGLDKASFTITRSTVTNSALVVNIAVTGSAMQGIDYTLSAVAAANLQVDKVSIPANAASVTIDLTPLQDSLSENTKDVDIEIVSPGGAYALGRNYSASATIADDGDRGIGYCFGVLDSNCSFAAAGDQVYTPPGGVTKVFVQMWGAAGGASDGATGGGGGYSEGILSVTPGTQYKLIVGQGGFEPLPPSTRPAVKTTAATYGGGGSGRYTYEWGYCNGDVATKFSYGAGGGRSAFCSNASGSSGLCLDVASEMLTAGGGGGGYYYSGTGACASGQNKVGGTGGGLSGGVATIESIVGTQTAGNGQFVALAGNAAQGGGAGWWAGKNGGGGSGHCTAGITSCSTQSATTMTPPRPTGYPNGTIATGAKGVLGGNGYILITPVYTPTPPSITISAGAGDGVPVSVLAGTQVTINATFAANGGDSLIYTAINGPNTQTAAPGVSWTPPTNKSYVFSTNVPGTYDFTPAAQTADFPAWNNYGKSVRVTVLAQCQNGTGAEGSCSACNSGYVLSGGSCFAQCPNGQGPAGSCTSCNSGYTLSGGSCVPVSTAAAIRTPLTATPPQVRKGSQTSLSWETDGMVSCSLSNTAGTIFSSALDSPSGGLPVVIIGRNVFTLQCSDGAATYTSSAVVTLVPAFIER